MLYVKIGSGKTLAYLFPVIQRVIELEKKDLIPSPSSRSPYIVVVTPTAELAE
jgi:superfamily II DNA/RNA helicase